MERQIKQRADALLNAKKKRKLWKNAAVTLAAAVVFCTVYALILPAITLSSEPVCGLAEHTHGDDCYTEKTVRIQSCAPDHTHTKDCFDEEGNQLCLYAGFWVHAHSDLCYDDTGELICTLEEREAHDHTDACYTTQLTCGQEESEGHAHTEDCYQLVCEETEEGHSHSENCYEKICGQEESGGHSHTDACYETSLTCGKEEIILHTHSDECYAHPEGQEPYLTCGQIEVQSHEHTDSCFETVSISELTCTTTEHTHSPECYASEEQETTEQTTAPTVSETEQEPLCGKEEHTHTDECYGPDPDGGEALLTCAVEAHTHTEECYLQPGREYRYEDETLLVTVVLPADSQVPETAKLLVTPITQEEDRYSQLEQQAQDAIAGTLTQIVLYDLSFYTGEAYLPVEDSAVVTITFLQGQLSEPAEQVTVLHYAQEEAAPVALREVEVQRDENEELSGLTFQTEGFSTYAVVLSNDPVAYAADEAALTLYPGQVRKVGACSLNIEIEGEDVVSAVSTAIHPAKLGLGTSSAFAEDMVDISNALYTFTKVADKENTYVISNGALYLNPSEGSAKESANIPNGSSANIVIEYNSGFYLKNETQISGGVQLYFHRNENTYYFDRQGEGQVDACCFLLYTPVTDGTEFSNEIPGYKQIASLAAITDNGQYLIVAEVGSAYYVLYPGTSTTDKYSHVAKVAPYELTITAKAPGTATVTAGTTSLNVTVTDEITVYAGKTVQIELPAGAEVTENENAGVAAVEIDENGMATVTGVAAGKTAVTITIGDDTYTWNITTKGTLVPGVTPAGTVINLFDYWVTGENEGQTTIADAGINSDHSLKFNWAGFGEIGTANRWTGYSGNTGVLQGIVKNTLTDGYPTLSGDKGTTEGEPLRYLFDPAMSVEYRKAYSNVGNLLQVDQHGYYYYDCKQNYAEFDTGTNDFLLYDTPAVGTENGIAEKTEGQFFPFDDFATASGFKTGENEYLNHYFGLTLTTRFVQQYGGFTNSNKDTHTQFHFSGDDDVWIFIDNTLVADLGGIHNAASVDIDFVEGTVIISNVYGEGASNPTPQTTYLKNIFNLDEDTFADNTYHTLKFFYLERGASASNLELKYNLSSYPATAITKVNQYGEPLAGVEFTVRSERGYEYSYKTDSNGQIVFVDDEGMPLSPDEIQSKFGDRFTLEETGVPAGYRKVGKPAELHFEKGVLVCDNTYTTGVWADPNLLVTAPRTLKLQSPYNGKSEITYYSGEDNINGSVFAVVLKYVGPDRGSASLENLAKEENWKPVYGTAESGYQLADTSSSFTQAVKYAASRYTESQNVFRLASNGSMQGTLNGMPGDITKYYYMLDDKGKTEYTVAYYWTPKEITNTSDIAGLAEIYPINSYDTAGTSVFGRTFGATINVPNVSNRVLVQKLDESGDPVNGAVFAVYEVEESGDNIFYQADGAQIQLEKDTDGDNKGTAKIGEANSTYEVNPQTGVITVTVQTGETTKTITPVMTGTTQSAEQNGMGEDGIVSFAGPDLSRGNYYIREISAPVGYKLNTQEIMMLITDTALYVNAGTEDDGIRVGRGPGFLVNTMEYAASNGDIDNTLTWIYTQLKASGVSSSFSDVTYNNYQNWKYVTNPEGTAFTGTRNGALTAYLEYSAPNHTGGSAANDQVLLNYILNEKRKPEGTEPVSSNRRLYTDVGWSYLEIYQDYAWGIKNKNSSANYADLREEGLLVDKETGKADGNIANLFSRSVYVQVTDERESCILEISKTVSGAPKDNSDTFDFTVELKDKAGKSLVGSYVYKVYSVDKDGERTEVPDIGGTIKSGGTITLGNGQIAVIKGLPCDAAYEITETLNSSYSTKVVEKVEGTTDQEGVYSPGEKTHTGTLSVKGKLYWHTDNGKLDNVSSVAFTNTYLAGLSIRKVAKMSNAPLSGAEFQFTKKDADGKTLYYSEADINHWVKDQTNLTTGEDGLIVLESIGAGTYTLTETKAPAGYLQLTSSITVTVDADGKITDATMDNKSLMDEVSDGKQLTIKNSTGYKLPETGGKGVQIYRWPGLALMLAACLYVLWGKKKRRHGHNVR